MSIPDVLVVGGGAFGTAAALTLRQRGHAVTLVDAGPVPHPDASSTDISKIVRMDYGADRFYAEFARDAMDVWRSWNEAMREPLYHETGMLVLRDHAAMEGAFEYESRTTLGALGFHVGALTDREVSTRYPAWPRGAWGGGYFNPHAGWAESGGVVAWQAQRCRDAGVRIQEGVAVSALHRSGEGVTGVETRQGETLRAGNYVIAAGAWTPGLVPELADRMWPVGQPVFHLAPTQRAPFEAPVFPIWLADIAHTGWYGFPVNSDGIVKVANHGAGLRIDPTGSKDVPAGLDEALRAFLRRKIPLLADAPVVGRRLCMYCDTFDGDFWIARHPDVPNLMVMAGGSGHGFKFCPLLGEVAADVLEGRDNLRASRFRWRNRERDRTEDARYRGDVFEGG